MYPETAGRAIAPFYMGMAVYASAVYAGFHPTHPVVIGLSMTTVIATAVYAWGER